MPFRPSLLPFAVSSASADASLSSQPRVKRAPVLFAITLIVVGALFVAQRYG